MAIEEMMQDIEAIKAQLEICSLKARHLRLVDQKDWAGYKQMLTEDFVLDISQSANVPVVRGCEAAVKQIQSSVEGTTTVHQAHLGEFELKADEVKVTWAIHDRVVRGPDQPSYTLYGYHHDRWVRCNGEWKLAALRQVTHHLDVHAPARS
jgi:hypothetical protein